MKKHWYEIIDFYKVTGLLLIWISSWLFMLPVQIDVNAPYFDNVWGAFFSMFGFSRKESANAQQLPDLLSTFGALFLMTILQLRGIFKFANYSENSEKQNENTKKQFRLLITVLNILGIIVHTLFFSIMIKIFLFPDMGSLPLSFVERMKGNIAVTIFVTVCITGMVLGVPTIAKLFLILLFCVGIFTNLSFVSGTLGVVGFLAIITSVIGFYLEFCTDGFDKEKLLIDFNILSGRYYDLFEKSKNEKLLSGDKK